MQEGKGRHLPLKILLALVSIVIIAALVFFGLETYWRHTTSLVMVDNMSATSMRIDRVLINDQPQETKGIVLKPVMFKPGKERIRDHSRTDHSAYSTWFKAPRAVIRFELFATLMNETGDQVSGLCLLDNRMRPCFFEVFYTDKRLVCSTCDNTTLLD